jgi:uncharacterized protein YqgC (DUF456 family)
MFANWQDLVQMLAFLGMALGMIGTVAPLLPGAILIWQLCWLGPGQMGSSTLAGSRWSCWR